LDARYWDVTDISIDWRLVAACLAGDATPEEQSRLDAWVRADPSRAAAIAELRGRWEASATSHVQTDRAKRDALWESLHARMHAHDHESEAVPAAHGHRSPPSTRTRRGIPRWAGMGFVIVGVVLGATLASIHSWVSWQPSRTAVAGHMAEYRTRPGQRAEIRLADGSRVSLSVASRLQILEHFGTRQRVVRLHGNAVFSVVHDTDIPFIVQAAGQSVRVLGTTFAVRAYDADSVATIAVREGKVSVRQALLTTGQAVTVTRDGRMTRGVATPDNFESAVGRLSFRGVPLADALPELERWYDVSIRLADPALGRERLTITVTDGGVSDLVAALEAIFPARVVRHGHTITIYAR
jgi:transmembrane sensor